MKVKDIIDALKLKVFTGLGGLDQEVTGGYTSDLLSDVIGHAEQGKIWITLQTHKNVLAVASLKDLPAIILTRNLEPEFDMLAQAEKEGIPVLGTAENAYEISGKLFNLLSS